MHVKKPQLEHDLEKQTDSKLGKKYNRVVYCHPAYLNSMQSSSCEMPGWMNRIPGSSAGKESTCNAGDPGSIPGSGRSAGEGTGYPLQYSWASLVAQLVKNLPTMWETWVQYLGWEDPLEKGKATHSSILVWRIPWTI